VGAPVATGVGARTSLDAARAIVARRRREDAAALKSLGAEQSVLSFPDCIYRRAGTQWRCSSEADLFAPDGPAEPALRKALASALAPFADACLVLAPLGLGRHVDHALTHSAAQGLPNVGFYEDVPYSLRPEGWAHRRVNGLSPHPWPLETVDLEAKSRACLAYASQWPTFWPDPDGLSADIRRAARSGWGQGVICEAVWLAPDSPLLKLAGRHHGHPHR
jgi:LmbE family N-acetylglucosaminyl deacetylase